ncbi:MAG: metallophosphoesterase [Candidatus Methanoperedens sp.]|nr:metallophosphoesterase [Candidatus Methanoperedens sp.]
MKIIDILIVFVIIAAASGCLGKKPTETSPVETPIFSTGTDSAGAPEYTIAYLSDGRPSKEKSNSERNLKIDFNQIISQSPTKRVDAVIMLGDMDTIEKTSKAYADSTARNIPVFYAIGNHELENKADLPQIRKLFASYPFNPLHGPDGSKETTYSFNVGDMHIVVLNEYWDGNNNGVCEWKTPSGGINADDSCFKYNNADGGFIPDALFNWLENDLDRNTKNWTIVTGHEPLYPGSRHVGDSLDKDKVNRDNLEKLFISKNVSAFIGAHTHGSSVIIKDNIFHVDAGVCGIQTLLGSGDSFASIIYTTINSSGYFKIIHAMENPTWITSKNNIYSK